jgi:putative restriction endonuclease
MREIKGIVSRQLNLRKSVRRSESDQNRKRRARNMDSAIQIAYINKLPVRVVVLDGTRRNADDASAKVTRASKRLLDPVFWAVTGYDWDTGECTVARGASPADPTGDAREEFEGFEGVAKKRFIVHRRRETKFRALKLEEALRLNRGHLLCEVPNCGFDFAKRYGAVGRGYAQVHHKELLSKSPKKGRKVTLKDLAVVCANCHVMIHHGGECRALETLIPKNSSLR